MSIIAKSNAKQMVRNEEAREFDRQSLMKDSLAGSFVAEQGAKQAAYDEYTGMQNQRVRDAYKVGVMTPTPTQAGSVMENWQPNRQPGGLADSMMEPI